MAADMESRPFLKSLDQPLLTTYSSEYRIFLLIRTNSLPKNSLHLSLQIVTLRYLA